MTPGALACSVVFKVFETNCQHLTKKQWVVIVKLRVSMRLAGDIDNGTTATISAFDQGLINQSVRVGYPTMLPNYWRAS
ncbi:MAG: hypothetical protein ACI9ES_000679 [Oceanospirillaceae bacterium]|jgi:hypothetical protein